MDISPTIGFAAECPYVLELDKTTYFFTFYFFSNASISQSHNFRLISISVCDPQNMDMFLWV